MSVATCRLKIPSMSSPLRILSRFPAESRIGVEKSTSHHLSQCEIGSDKLGGLNGSTQHGPEVQSAGVSTAKFIRER